MRTLLTGVDSFIGSNLAKTLVTSGDEVFGLSRREEGCRAGVTRLKGDIGDADLVRKVIERSKPDRIFHLAAQSRIPYSFSHPQETVSVNVIGSLNLFEVVRSSAAPTVLVSVGSSAEYGRMASRFEYIGEEQPLEPTSPYGISKASQGMLGGLYARVYNLRLMHVRPFAIIGPGKEGDALGDFCQRIVEIEGGQGDVLHVGNLSAFRDFVDIRDCVAALVLVSQKGKPGETYNICNGRAASLNDMVQLLQKLSTRPFTLVADAQRGRPSDDPRIVGNNEKLCGLGYTPRYAFEDTVRDALDFWRKSKR